MNIKFQWKDSWAKNTPMSGRVNDKAYDNKGDIICYYVILYKDFIFKTLYGFPTHQYSKGTEVTVFPNEIIKSKKI